MTIITKVTTIKMSKRSSEDCVSDYNDGKDSNTKEKPNRGNLVISKRGAKINFEKNKGKVYPDDFKKENLSFGSFSKNTHSTNGQVLPILYKYPSGVVSALQIGLLPPVEEELISRYGITDSKKLPNTSKSADYAQSYLFSVQLYNDVGMTAYQEKIVNMLDDIRDAMIEHIVLNPGIIKKSTTTKDQVASMINPFYKLPKKLIGGNYVEDEESRKFTMHLKLPWYPDNKTKALEQIARLDNTSESRVNYILASGFPKIFNVDDDHVSVQFGQNKKRRTFPIKSPVDSNYEVVLCHAMKIVEMTFTCSYWFGSQKVCQLKLTRLHYGDYDIDSIYTDVFIQDDNEYDDDKSDNGDICEIDVA